MAITVPYRSDGYLRDVAERFLSEHHPSRALPIPIEEIIDLQLGIDIIPMPGFHVVFDVDAFISTDFTEIRVDKTVYEAQNKNRYRFSLAHELAHRLMHGDVFQQLQYNSIAEYKQSRDSIPEREYGRMEFQAYAVAGLILVPPSELATKFAEAKAHAERVGIDLCNARPEAWDSIERWLASEFQVSQAVIAKRAPKDGLWDSDEM